MSLSDSSSSGSSLAYTCPACGSRTAAIPCHVCGRVFEPSGGDTVVSDNSAAPVIGATTLGGYRIEQSLGGGGMGVVLLARDTDDRPVVIKAPRDHDERARARFTREARALTSLDHPGIVRLRDLDATTDGAPLLVLQHLPGVTLRSVLRHRRLGLAAATTVALELCRALDHCHRRGVVHRDLKPENIIVGAGRLWLIDFGLARVDVSGSPPSAVDYLTPAGAILGTPPYTAPEQIQDPRTAGFAADAYSLGMVLRECFPEAHLQPLHLRAGCHTWWHLIDRLCDPDPHRRPTPSMVLAAAPSVPESVQAPAAVRRPRREKIAVLVALMVGLLVGGAVMLQHHGQVTPLTRSISGVSEPGRSGSVVLELPPGERLRITPEAGTRIRLPGGGPWRQAPLLVHAPADGRVAIRMNDDDGLWRLHIDQP